MAELLREELGIDALLKVGHAGIFTVEVNGVIVATKTVWGFPEPIEIINAVENYKPG